MVASFSGISECCLNLISKIIAIPLLVICLPQILGAISAKGACAVTAKGAAVLAAKGGCAEMIDSPGAETIRSAGVRKKPGAGAETTVDAVGADTLAVGSFEWSPAAAILYGSPLPISNWRRSFRRAAPDVVSTRSVPLAFGMSAVVPGLGQVYNRDWIGTAIFVAVEAALVAGWASWKSSGNDGVEAYEQFAHQSWSPIQYAEWLNAFSGYNGPPIEPPSISENEFRNPDTWTATERAEVDAFFADIRRAERSSIYLQTGATFSHVLPNFGEQQYYELIGKYFQYAPGWRDYSGDPDEDPREVMPEDANFYVYSENHAAANDDLRRASVAGALVIVNHFAAAVQAAVIARMHNMRIQPSVGLSQSPSGELIAKARIAVTL